MRQLKKMLIVSLLMSCAMSLTGCATNCSKPPVVPDRAALGGMSQDDLRALDVKAQKFLRDCKQ